MLDFFRKYQRYFFFVITAVMISSIVFFGTYSTFGGVEEAKDQIVGQKIDGSSMTLSEIKKLAHFLSSDREDFGDPRAWQPNFCNPGVVRYDLIKDGIADLLVSEYFEEMKEELGTKLDRAKRFKSYAHPEADFLSAKAVWEQLSPAINREIAFLKEKKEADLEVFQRLKRLYQLQAQIQPEMLRQILIYQHRQYPWLALDQRLSYEDLSLFGFHNASDWFGKKFVELAAQFILNTAIAAEEKGYRVSLQEASGDLIHTFQESMDKLGKTKGAHLSFHSHLHSLGFNEKSAAEVWQKVLLFRRYFQDVGSAAFIDKLPYKDFAKYAGEEAIVQTYCWPIQLKSGKDLAEFQFYVKAVCPKTKDLLPNALLSIEEIERKYPQLVQTTYKAQVAAVSKKELGLRVGVKQLWDWQTEEGNWALLCKQFSLPNAETKEKRFQILEQLEVSKRALADSWSREKIVEQNPIWIEEALKEAEKKEKIWSSAANESSQFEQEGFYIKVENQEVLKAKHLLTFNEARPVLAKLASGMESEYSKEKNPFALASKEALEALQKKKGDSRWLQTGEDVLTDQFKLEKKEQAILRTSKEDWMKEKAFMMLPDLWSPIHVADNGQVVFFYLQEKKTGSTPILDQLSLGKEMIASDAKAYAAERLLKKIKVKHAIVLPVQRGDE